MAANGGVSLADFLSEAELSHFAGVFKSVLRVERVDQLKLVGEADLQRIGMLGGEQRRLKKLLNKYYPQSYLGKFVKVRCKAAGCNQVAHALSHANESD